jgi:hypothetical protein
VGSLDPPQEDDPGGRTGLTLLQWKIYEADRAGLTVVIFNEESIDQRGIDMLVGFRKLTELYMPYASFPLTELLRFCNLECLAVRELILPGIAGPLATNLRTKVKKLEALLILAPMNITDAERLIGSRLPCLCHLTVRGPLTDQQIQDLDERTELSTLEVVSTTNLLLSSYHFAEIADELILRAPVASGDFSDVFTDGHLRRLRLYNCTNIADFSFLKYFDDLRRLTLRNAPELTPNSLSSVFRRRKLDSLDLSGTPALNDSLLQLIAENHLKLEYLIAVHNTTAVEPGFSSEGLAAFLSWNENIHLKFLDISGHRLISKAALSSNICCLRRLNLLGLRRTQFNNLDSVQFLVQKRTLLEPPAQAGEIEVITLPKLKITISTLDGNSAPSTENIGTSTNRVEVEIDRPDTTTYYGCDVGDANSLNEFLMV